MGLLIEDLTITKIEEGLRAVLLAIKPANGFLTPNLRAVDIEEIRPHAQYQINELPRLFILDDEDRVTNEKPCVHGELKLQIQGLMLDADYKQKNALVNDVKRAIWKDTTWGGSIYYISGGMRTLSDLGVIKPYSSFVITVIAHYKTNRENF